MKLSTQIKQFFAKMGLKVRVRTGTGKGRWLSAWIPSEPGGHELVYKQPPFPLDLRIQCLKVIYPNIPSCWSGNAGNIRFYDIAMHEGEWQTILATYKPTEA
jgi:hypothetical protein